MKNAASSQRRRPSIFVNSNPRRRLSTLRWHLRAAYITLVDSRHGLSCMSDKRSVPSTLLRHHPRDQVKSHAAVTVYASLSAVQSLQQLLSCRG